MSAFEFVEPERVIVTAQNGRSEIYALSKMPDAVQNEVTIEFFSLPRTKEKLDALILKVFAYVGIVMVDDVARPLSTWALIMNNTADYNVRIDLVRAMMLYNSDNIDQISKIDGFILVKRLLVNRADFVAL